MRLLLARRSRQAAAAACTARPCLLHTPPLCAHLSLVQPCPTPPTFAPLQEEALSSMTTVKAHAAEASTQAAYSSKLAAFYRLQRREAAAYAAYM